MVAHIIMVMIDEALSYAKLELRIIPLYSVKNGRCTCKYLDCTSVGKHPATIHGVKDATTDENRIADWWLEDSDANVGIATGGGIVVVDIDPRNGGDKSLTQLFRQNQVKGFPKTWRASTGGGGEHYYFRSRYWSRKVAQGIDLQSTGKYVVAPPSVHASGRKYEWIQSPWETNLADAPEWLKLRELKVTARRIEADLKVPAEIPQGERNNRLFRRAVALYSKDYHPRDIISDIFDINYKHCHPPLNKREIYLLVKSATSGRYFTPE